MRKPLVTIGIPCFNCAAHLPALLRSLDQQNFDSWTAIAIDDGSSDGTAEFLRALRHPRIEVILGEKNLGLGARLNQIHELARTEYIVRTDADDLMHPERLSRQIACFEADPALDVCASGTYTIDNQNRLLGIRRVPPLARTPEDVMRRNGPSHPTITARRSWFLRFPYRAYPKRGEDLDLWVRSVSTSRILQLDEPLHFIREDPEFDLRKYRRTLGDHRIWFRQHGDSFENPLALYFLLMCSHGKEAAYTTLAAAGLAGRLAARRNVPIPPRQLAQAEKILARILGRSNGKQDAPAECDAALEEAVRLPPGNLDCV